jgi:hypothetical protein
MTRDSSRRQFDYQPASQQITFKGVNLAELFKWLQKSKSVEYHKTFPFLGTTCENTHGINQNETGNT